MLWLKGINLRSKEDNSIILEYQNVTKKQAIFILDLYTLYNELNAFIINNIKFTVQEECLVFQVIHFDLREFSTIYVLTFQQFIVILLNPCTVFM